MAGNKSSRELFEEFRTRFQEFAHAFADAVARADERRYGHFPDREDVAQEAAIWATEMLPKTRIHFTTKVRSLIGAVQVQQARLAAPAYARDVADRRALAEYQQAVARALAEHLTPENRPLLAARLEGKAATDSARKRSEDPWAMRQSLADVAIQVERKIEQYRVSGATIPQESASTEIRRVGHEHSFFKNHGWHWRDCLTYVIVGELKADDVPRQEARTGPGAAPRVPGLTPFPPQSVGSEARDELRREYRQMLAGMGIQPDSQTSRFEAHRRLCGQCARDCLIVETGIRIALELAGA